MHNDNSGAAGTGYRSYVTVWAVLLLLTAATVAFASIGTGAFSNILIASVKAALVLWIFMDLRDEPRLLKVMLLVVVLTLTLLILLTFADILYR